MQPGNHHDPNLEKLDRKTDREWRRLSEQVMYFRSQKKSCHTNPRLLSIADGEPQSPIAPVLRLWRADNFAKDRRFADAVRSYDQALMSSQSTRIFHPNQNIVAAALTHKAHSLVLAGDLNAAIATYLDLFGYQPANKGAAFHAGLLAERLGKGEMAHEYYQRVACTDYSVDTDDPAQLAKRAIDRLHSTDAVFCQSAEELADILKVAIKCRDTSQLHKLVSKTHFAIGHVGGETGFEDLELIDVFLKDFISSSVCVKPVMGGKGNKRYLTLKGFKGKCFRGNVSLMITRSPRGWQWSGIALHNATRFWFERLQPALTVASEALTEANESLPDSIEVHAPWPRGVCFTAGGLGASPVDSIIMAAGFFGFVLAAAVSALNCCGYGPRGLYYNNQSTHVGKDEFAIDFARYKRYFPFLSESGGTHVLAALDGIVGIVVDVFESGYDGDKNYVEIFHADPKDPSIQTRFMSRYLHLAGPKTINVSRDMPVRAGMLLGYVNDTGNSAMDHLHFSIHDLMNDGKSVRPTPMSGQTLGDHDSGKCITSDNIEHNGTINMIIPSSYITENWLIVPAGVPANQPPTASVAEQQWTLTLSGIAIIDFKGFDTDWWRETVLLQPSIRAAIFFAVETHNFPVPSGMTFTPQFEVNQYVLHATLSSIFNNDTAENAGFAVDNWQPHPFAVDTDIVTNAQMFNLFNGIEVDVAVSDSDGYIHRLSYHITLLGKIRMGQPVVVL